MTTKTRKATSMKERLVATAAKGDAAISTKRDTVKDSNLEVEEAITPVPGKAAPKTLPKVTLYAHKDVLKAIRILAATDGTQAQAILRNAVREYLAGRGHHFTDLTTGKQG